jgi:hypothetical protein
VLPVSGALFVFQIPLAAYGSPSVKVKQVTKTEASATLHSCGGLLAYICVMLYGLQSFKRIPDVILC